MTGQVDQAIAALRTGQQSLVRLTAPMAEPELTGRSAASEWTIADVLSHLGSGAEIMLAWLEAALGEAEKPEPDFRESVWDRWNARTPQEQADEFVASNEALVGRFEGLDRSQRDHLRVDLGFLPEPVDVLTLASLRLNEFTLHAWDIAVVSDPAATLAPEAVDFLFEPLRLLIGWIGRTEALDADRRALTVRTTDPDRLFGLDLGETVSLVDPPADSAPVLSIPAEAFLRLTAGRLAPEHTPPGISLDTTSPTLDDLRKTFPGF
ncbi:maleylpyruvate isomerase family mycothiol-dependent enzyme [Micromonospora sp. DT229]|uniref:maleylpyruvate isomerase family mycothiol-dependent enzyme n=1 Tax=Micromonospora sp. DT229 TaxID=3393430 RepID=UPI003CEDCC35